MKRFLLQYNFIFLNRRKFNSNKFGIIFLEQQFMPMLYKRVIKNFRIISLELGQKLNFISIKTQLNDYNSKQ